jgi:hypothetical protein
VDDYRHRPSITVTARFETVVVYFALLFKG